jgi:N-acetylglutamate synthase-like GNAT family acetyltransferase
MSAVPEADSTAKPAVQVRAARPEDVPRILELIRMMHAETAPLPLSEPRIRGFVAHAMQRGVVLVTEQDGEIGGTSAMVADAPWYSESLQISDGWVFVHPDFRRTPHASTLLRAMVAYALHHKVPLHAAFMCRPDLADRVRAMGRLYERILGQPVGLIFYMPAG